MEKRMIAIEWLIEALCNPEGRFRTLERLLPERDEHQEVVYSIRKEGTLLDFRVQVAGRSGELTVGLRNPGLDAGALLRLEGCLQRHPASWQVVCRFLAQEVLLFDGMGQPFYLDAWWSELPDGDSLSKALARAVQRNDRAAIRKMAQECCRMGIDLLQRGLVHGNLKPSNLWITSSGEVRLLHYEQMEEVPTVQEYDMNETARRECMTLGNLALGLKVLSEVPELYPALNGDSLFRTPVLRSALLPLFGEMARQAGAVALEQMVKILSLYRGDRIDRQQMCRTLEALGEEQVVVKVTPTQMASLRGAPLVEKCVEKEPSASSSPLRGVLDRSLYDWVSQPSEALICVQRGTRWGYLHTDGSVAIALQYDWADDFREGRAVVKCGEQFGMIDKEGNEIIPVRYESVDWDCDHAVACVSEDGRVGLWNRNGQQVMEPCYDWMGDIRQSDLLLVCREGKCGFIRHSGEEVIPLQYEDASDFGADSLARVVSQGREFYIDTQGREVSAER